MRLGGVDDVVAVIEPVADQRLDQRRRMLAVAVHEQHGAEAGMVEAGEQRGLLAEIARQRDHLDVERVGRQRARDRQRVVAAAVVDIDDLGREPPAFLAAGRRSSAMRACKRGKPGGLVEDRDDDRQAGFAAPARSHRCGAGACCVQSHGRSSEPFSVSRIQAASIPQSAGGCRETPWYIIIGIVNGMGRARGCGTMDSNTVDERMFGLCL